MNEATGGSQEVQKLLEKIFSSRAQTRVVQHFLDRPKEFFNLSRIAKETGLAHSTIHRVMQPLVDLGLIKEINIDQTETHNPDSERCCLCGDQQHS